MPGLSPTRGISADDTSYPRVLVQSAIPFILPSSGTIGNNGALSAITALPTIYSGGCWMYFPASAISAGSSAGWYWAVMSSTTTGTIYNSIYTSGISFVGVATAFATTGPGAYTQTTGSFISGPVVTLQGGSLGANGQLIVQSFWSVPNNANNKLVNYLFDGNQFGGASMGATSTVGYALRRSIANRNSPASQTSHGSSANAWEGTAAQYFTVNTAIDKNVALAANLAVATDYLVLERFELLVQYGA